jgi:hypothetical protein
MAWKRARESVAWACALLLVQVAPSASAAGRIHQCEPHELRCTETPTEGVVISVRGAAGWARRATSAVLAESASERERSKDAAIVVADGSVRLPRRHRLVWNRSAGERALLTCGSERLLLVVSQRGVHRKQDGSVVADLGVAALGATCERQERKLFEHGIDWFRVIFSKGRVEILLTARLAD